MLLGPGGVMSSARDMVSTHPVLHMVHILILPQTRWITALLPGVESLLPDYAVLPACVLFDITEARVIVFGRSPLRSVSMVGYGMGWMRWSLFGDEVRGFGPSCVRLC